MCQLISSHRPIHSLRRHPVFSQSKEKSRDKHRGHEEVSAGMMMVESLTHSLSCYEPKRMKDVNLCSYSVTTLTYLFYNWSLIKIVVFILSMRRDKLIKYLTNSHFTEARTTISLQLVFTFHYLKNTFLFLFNQQVCWLDFTPL